MPELIRPSTVLPANRRPISITTTDGLKLVGEVATPLAPRVATLLCLHPLPTHGGMMDSHILKKAANRLPAMADIEIVRFNTRGTSSESGTSEGAFDFGNAERLDVEAAINFALEQLQAENLWVLGWSFGTDMAIRYARNSHVKGLILLSPPLRTSTSEDLDFWASDGRPITALIPEHDDYLKPPEAAVKFAPIPQIKLVNVDEAKHLWVGEPSVYRVLTEVVSMLNPVALPLPEGF